MTIVAYTFQADLYCPDHIGAAVQETLPLDERHPVDEDGGEYPWDTEWLLDQLAKGLGIDRYDEHTFDSDHFPKVVFAGQLEEEEHCANPECEEAL